MGFYDHFARRSRNGIGEWVKRLQAKKIFDLGLAHFVGGNASVLEIGPGDGYVAVLAKSAGLAYQAVEGSQMVAQALRAMGHDVIDAMVPPLPYTNVADVCFLLHVIEHMKDSATAQALVSDIGRTLTASGVLVIACPDYIRWGSRFFDCDYTHQLPMTHRRLRQLLENEGFSIAFQGSYAGPIFGWFGNALFSLGSLMLRPILDDLLRRLVPSDIAFRALLTVAPCLLVVARKA